jgi:ABC-2 type transport system permease protein
LTEIYRGTWVIAYRELLQFLRDRPRILLNAVFPLLFLAVFGAGFTNLVGPMAGGIDLIRFMYPGVIAMAVLTTALSAGLSVVTDREAGFLREILVAPVGRSGVVLGKATGTAGVALLQTLILLLIAPFVGVPLEVEHVLKLLPIVAILALGLACLGILIASFLRSQQGFQMLLQLLVFPLVFLAGVFYPVNSLPPWMEVLSKVNPATYGVDAIRQIFLGTGPAGAGLGVSLLGHTMTVAEELAIIGLLGVILAGAAAWAFGREE